MKILAILGASGHGRVIADAALSSGLWQLIQFYDDAYPTLQCNGRFPVVGDSAALAASGLPTVVAIGDNVRRLEKQQWLQQAGLPIATVCHPSAVIACDVVLGDGCVVLAGAVINSGAQLGKACIINSRAVVEHDCELADAVHLSPAASLGGGCRLGTAVWVGIGAAVRHLITLEEFSIVGAGAAVVKPVLTRQIVAGVPAQLIKMNK
ncbi:acetyltransferase [Rheinheimera riviphila]|uniref:Acetyltransferase n=1 Tax=Rheinheimera riviphila TaxID=1834037 RepID=A0A437R3C4_9GAMM|nr:acetyltransferase [Rheinheimera riviphila]RVU41286.1 acetyltransferase [Rheinheimera riviphila]